MGQPGAVRTSDELDRFLTDCVGIVDQELIPPLVILNQFLDAGEDVGRSHRWKPFQIDQEEYEELVLSLITTPESDFEEAPPPDWVRTPTDWYYWCYEHRVGIPAREHRELSEASEAWRLKSIQAKEAGDEELAAQYHWKFCQIGQQLVELTEPYILRFRETRRRR